MDGLFVSSVSNDCEKSCMYVCMYISFTHLSAIWADWRRVAVGGWAWPQHFDLYTGYRARGLLTRFGRLSRFNIQIQRPLPYTTHGARPSLQIHLSNTGQEIISIPQHPWAMSVHDFVCIPLPSRLRPPY